MDKIETFLHSLLSAPGLSGFEEPVRKQIEDEWRPLTDELTTSPLGSLHGLRRAYASTPRPSVMVAAHMDAIGLMVKEIQGTFLKVSKIGGIDPRVLPGQPVLVHGRKEIPGIVQMIPDRLLNSSAAGSPPNLSRLFVDTGLPEKELQQQVQPGDLVSFASTPMHHEGGYISGHSLDNRASVAAITVCLQELKRYQLEWNLWCVATVMEEEFLQGALTSAFALKPEIGIAVDVTFAEEPGLKTYTTFPLGKGPTIGTGANVHPALQRKFKQIAEEIDLPYAVETMPRGSGTDGMAIQITAAGIPTMVLGIPIRYMHTPYELTSMADIRRVGRLLARFITSLEEDTLATLFTGGDQ
ncbi:MAG: M20/M25/M40 family metallo-hydrolase [Anaerolineaceae bacterium]